MSPTRIAVLTVAFLSFLPLMTGCVTPGCSSEGSSRRKEAPSQAVSQSTMSSVTSFAADDVVWSWTRRFKRRVESFAIKPDEAFKIARRGREKLERPISRESGFIVGRWYWFGRETKADGPLAGYYVNGDSGKLEYRESDKIIKTGSRKLPKNPWGRITPLSEAGTDK